MRPLKQNPRKVLDWHIENGSNVSKTARHFDVSRETVYNYLRRIKSKVKERIA